VVPPGEMAAVLSPRSERVVGDDHYKTPACVRDCLVQRVDDLMLRIGGAIGVGIERLGPMVQPPLRIQKDQAYPPAQIDHAGTGAAVFRQKHNGSAARRIDERLLAPNGLPAVLAESRPVMVARHDVAFHPGAGHNRQLGRQPALRFLPVGLIWSREPTGIDVVS
jgi:hypothetical protein